MPTQSLLSPSSCCASHHLTASEFRTLFSSDLDPMLKHDSIDFHLFLICTSRWMIRIAIPTKHRVVHSALLCHRLENTMALEKLSLFYPPPSSG